MLDLLRNFTFPLSVPKDVVWEYGGEVEGPPFLVWDGGRTPLISLMMLALYSGLSLGKLHQDLPHWEQSKSNWKHSCFRAYHTASFCHLPKHRRKFLDSVYINMSWGRFWTAEMGPFALARPHGSLPPEHSGLPGDTTAHSFPSVSPTTLLFLPSSSERQKALPFSLPPLNELPLSRVFLPGTDSLTAQLKCQKGRPLYATEKNHKHFWFVPQAPFLMHSLKLTDFRKSFSLSTECVLSHAQLFVIPWTLAYQAPRSMGFSRQEYWSGLPLPFPRDLLDPGIVPCLIGRWIDLGRLIDLGSPLSTELVV